MSTPPSFQGAVAPRKSRLKALLITIACGALLAAGSCAGFLSTLSFNSGNNAVATFFAIAFFFGIALILIGAVRALVVLILSLYRGNEGP
jgi:hypothetical protein